MTNSVAGLGLVKMVANSALFGPFQNIAFYLPGFSETLDSSECCKETSLLFSEQDVGVWQLPWSLLAP